MKELNEANQKWLDENLEQSEGDYSIALGDNVRMKLLEMQKEIEYLKTNINTV